MSQSIYVCAPNQTREQDLAQAELEAYIEAQTQAIAPEPDIMFIDINDTYDFKCYVGREVIAEISFDISNNIQPWSISIAGVEVQRTNIHPDAMDWVKMHYTSKLHAIALRTQRACAIKVKEEHNSEYVVYNQNNGHHYVVRPLHPNPRERCECGDCHFRGIKCKHQIAVESFINARSEKVFQLKF
ncbi:hypothetical protein AB0758_48955 [Tolypothrix bouteillei VB521301_2]|uniref:SWIM-type domain-containing protein n=1 Tax=Tolypothrix bouteillei VB521301 TaxID=1479485 RepID=A0A0C1RQ12_9CYAN